MYLGSSTPEEHWLPWYFRGNNLEIRIYQPSFTYPVGRVGVANAPARRVRLEPIYFNKYDQLGLHRPFLCLLKFTNFR